MLLEVLDLHHDLLGVLSLLRAQDLEFVARVLLHEDVVLVEHFDRRVDLYYLACLQVFKVHLPLLGLLTERVQLGLQVRDLMLCKLFESAHDLFDSSHFLCESVVGEACVLDRLVLKCVHLTHLICQCRFEELLAFGNSVRDLSHLFN